MFLRNNEEPLKKNLGIQEMKGHPVPEKPEGESQVWEQRCAMESDDRAQCQEHLQRDRENRNNSFKKYVSGHLGK